MDRIKNYTKDQKILFAKYAIKDRLNKNHRVYQFDELLDTIDISPIMKKYTTRGGAMHSPRNMLALLMYAYFEGITSSRKIAELIQSQLDYIYLAGGNQMKHRSISEFRRKNLHAIKEIFIQFISLALEAKLAMKKFTMNTFDGNNKKKKAELISEIEIIFDCLEQGDKKKIYLFYK